MGLPYVYCICSYFFLLLLLGHIHVGRKRAEEAQKAALEAEKRATKEAVEREATETRKVLADHQVVQKEANDLRLDANAEASQELKNKGLQSKQ
ncbi:hypothetical protein NE237_000128 [Protea cynaroides]|uniref:Uncharacterized protein n=1 Tax=Protea cynaroides TaxID=273540 RepID=A0A9Q0GM35_9MAGN|nr:hypothetical protein NE237_000128 [Protea cynaroides]